MNTPVSLPRNAFGSRPDRSTASHDTSSTCRCCGSMIRASRGPIPKKPASNCATSARKPPYRVEVRPARPGSGSNSAGSQPRSAGNSPITSCPAATISHSCSGVRTPPGKRHPMPRIAIGSAGRERNSSFSRCSAWLSLTATRSAASSSSSVVTVTHHQSFGAARRGRGGPALRRPCCRTPWSRNRFRAAHRPRSRCRRSPGARGRVR